MGKIAEALKANLKEIAQSDARALREIDNELRKASALYTRMMHSMTEGNWIYSLAEEALRSKQYLHSKNYAEKTRSRVIPS